MQLGELADQIIVGRSLRGLATDGASRPVLNLRDVTRVLAPMDNLDTALATAAEIERLQLEPGDVVVTARGNIRAAVVSGYQAGTLLGANLIAIRLRNSLSPHLLAAFLRHPTTIATLTADFAGTTTAGFTVDSLRRLPIQNQPANPDKFADLIRYVDLYTTRQARALQLYEQAADEAAFQCLAPHGPEAQP